MENLSEAFSSLLGSISVASLSIAIGFLWSIFKFLDIRKRESDLRQFESYHRLIGDLVSPGKGGQVYLDSQVAIVFELRRFKRYREVTERILQGFRNDCASAGQHRLTAEIDLTLKALKPWCQR